MAKDKIQDTELEQVSGGLSHTDIQPINCKNCQTRFDAKGRTHRDITTGSGCNEKTVCYYQCPNCKKWVDTDGVVNPDLN